jgi:hypothetical protein
VLIAAIIFSSRAANNGSAESAVEGAAYSAAGIAKARASVYNSHLMFPDVKSVRYLHDYQLELTFADGVKGRVDFAPLIVGHGGVFAPLEDKNFFAQASVNADIGTIVWPNDADFDPEVLYSHITGRPIPGLISEVAG